MNDADRAPAPKLTPTRLDALRAVAAGKVTKHRELHGGGHFWVRDRARVAKTPYEWLRTNGLIRAAGVTFLRGGTFEPAELGHRALEAAGGARVSRRVWFWAPQWHWFGWGTLVPFYRGEDEHGRVTLVLGWTVTGRVVVALWECSNPVCIAYREA